MFELKNNLVFNFKNVSIGVMRLGWAGRLCDMQQKGERAGKDHGQTVFWKLKTPKGCIRSSVKQLCTDQKI